jgi:putative nucleotidyltransferase with HDIG domain
MNTLPSGPMFDAAARLCARLRQAGHRALWAGGCVRDLLLGRMSKDVDVATSARPDEVAALFPDAKPVGRAFGVMLVPTETGAIEVATFRDDGAYRDGRHPESVRFSDERGDARRRDFTINALFLDPATGETLDYVDGRRDLDARVLRCVGDPAARFREDHLRLLRAVRFASVLEFELEPETEAAIRAASASVASVSLERVRMEYTRMLQESPRPGAGVALARRTGLLKPTLPEVDALAGVSQPAKHHGDRDVFEHTCAVLDGMGPGASLELAWAALLHDIGKPPTRRLDADGRPARPSFPGHADRGAHMAETLLTRYRFSNAARDTIVACIREHSKFQEAAHMRRSTLMLWAARPWMDTLLELHRLDRASCGRGMESWEIVRAAREEWRRSGALPVRLLSGHDLASIGLRGPAIGEALHRAYAAQLDHPDWTREQLLDWVRREGALPAAGAGDASA